MATKTIVLAIISLILASLASHGVSAPALAPASVGAPSPEAAGALTPAADVCLTALTNMSDCLTFVEDGSKLKKPDKGCCPELAGLVDSNPICLCQLLGNSDSIGIKIDNNKALKLPSICGVPTPPVSTCSAIGVPVSLPPSMTGDSMSPNMAPKGSAPSPSNTAADSSGGPSPASSSSENKSGASVIKSSGLTFICVLSIFSISIFF